MGSSPKATLFYGFDLGEMVDADYESTAPSWWQEAQDVDDGVDWEDELARRLGWVEVPCPDDWPSDRSAVAEWKSTSENYRRWSASRDLHSELVDSHPVDMESYGSEGHLIRVRASVQRVSDWGVIQVRPLVVDPVWRAQLKHFAALMEFELPEDAEPAWHLSADYA